MDEVIATAIAGALATRAADAAASAGRSAWSALVHLVRSKLGSAGEPSAALQSALDRPVDPATIKALAEALTLAARADPYFAVQVEALWDRASTDFAAADGTINQISGTVHGNVIQARDVTVRGDIW